MKSDAVNPTTRRFKRALDECPVSLAEWGDREVTSTFAPSEAASACSEFGHDDPPRARTVSRWTRIKRAVRTWWLWRWAKP